MVRFLCPSASVFSVLLHLSSILTTLVRANEQTYPCDDGSAPNEQGCCANDKCPSCCLLATEFRRTPQDAPTCKCIGCAGSPGEENAECATADGCIAYLERNDGPGHSWSELLGCSLCHNDHRMCWAVTDAAAAPGGTCQSGYFSLEAPGSALSPLARTITSVDGKITCSSVSLAQKAGGIVVAWVSVFVAACVVAAAGGLGGF
jgi:hypothetical protein